MRGAEGGFGGKPPVPLAKHPACFLACRGDKLGVFIIFFIFILLRLQDLRAASAAMLEPE